MPENARVARPQRAASRWGTFAAALFVPDRAFAGGGAERIPKAGVCVLAFLLVVAGARLGAGTELTPQSQSLAMAEFDARFGSFFRGAPADVQAQARERMGAAALGSASGLALAFTLALRGAWFVLSVIELWLLGLIATQFFGGQEERGADGLRPSLGLFLAASVPMAARRLLAGLVAALRSPEAATNALTLSEFRVAAAVRFDLLSLAGARDPAPFVAAFVRPLTDPFVLWAIVILLLGGREVFRLRMKGAVGQVLVLVAVAGLQSWLLGRAGIPWEL
ncbi:MAG: hypothetical protein A2177_14480 [Spirochaetes bacterium RBG_13_68_11]|nr:MAG: hypothetical protein A2177_14480 [Spirochaetes bacterium RBG_13_68_11]